MKQLINLVNRHAQLWASLIILALAVDASLQEPRFVVQMRDRVFDAYQRWQPREYRSAPVRIINIDEESLEKLGQWPWPRTKLADLVSRLREMGAAVVALDMVFAEPDRTSPTMMIPLWRDQPRFREWLTELEDHDDQFASVLGDSPAVTGFALLNNRTSGQPAMKAGMVTVGEDPRPFLPVFSGAVVTLPKIEAAARGNGALNVILGYDGVIRRLPLFLRLNDEIYPSLIAEALRVAQGANSYTLKTAGSGGELRFGESTGITHIRIGAFTIPTGPQGEVWAYLTSTVADRFIPAWHVLEGTADPAAIEGAIVFVGSTAAGLQDIHATPLGTALSGVVIHAQVLEQILHGEYLTRPDWAKGAEVSLMVLLSALLLVLGSRIGILATAVIGVVATALAAGASWYAFSHTRLLLDPLFPVASVLAVYLVFSLLRHLRSEREQRWVRRAFSSYLSPKLVEELVHNPEQLKLGGERRELTFLFTDLEGFTALVERSAPTVVVPLLNEYLDGMIRIAFKHDGTVDKIVGDALHVIFGAPVAQPDHAERALACALDIDAFARAFAAEKQKQGIAFGQTRIGVNSGTAIVGNFGGELRFDYTAHGDAINTAARLESVNKQLGTRIVVSGDTVALCRQFTGRPVGALVLKGKTQGIQVFEPLPAEAVASPSVVSYLKAYELLDASDGAAVDAFASLVASHPDDGLAAFHLRRLQRGEGGTTVTLTEK